MANKSARIAIAAETFCYGPAAIAIAILLELRRAAPQVRLQIDAIATSVTKELLSGDRLFDEIRDPVEFLSDVKLFTEQYNCIVVIADIEFAKQLTKVEGKVVFVDPLYWMWTADTISEIGCSKYIVVDFPGVRNLLEERFDQYLPRHVEVVEPVCSSECENIRGAEIKKGTALINFGGVESKLGINLNLAVTLTQAAVEACARTGLVEDVLICSGKNAAASLSAVKHRYPLSIRIDSLPQNKFLRELSQAEYIFTVPGLSIVYEALSLGRKVMFLPSLNYSQHLQVKAYKQSLSGFDFVTWDDLPGYSLLPSGLEEADGVNAAIEIGDHFSKDVDTKKTVQVALEGYLNRVQRQGKSDIGLSSFWSGEFLGAAQIAEIIIQLIDAVE